ncbi:MAG: heme-binding protein, partial [Limisphaerales bacterium]
MSKPAMTRIGFFIALLFALSVQGVVPEWIWHHNDGEAPGNNEVRYFRKTFQLESKPAQAVLSIIADDEAEVWVNGTKSASVKGWNAPTGKEVASRLKEGENVIAIRGKSEAGEAAVMLQLAVGIPRNNGKHLIVTDGTWLASKTGGKGWEQPNFSPTGDWVPAKTKGKAGAAPWGEVMKVGKATPASEIKILPGFKIELLHSAELGEGSWICMTVDDKGRLIISPQSNDQPLFRITLSKSGQIEKWETIETPIRQAMGLLYAYDSLYANCHGPKGVGLYRLVDKNRNDQFDADEFELLKNFDGVGEHGYHAVILGPDKKIYVMNGNHTKVPEGISPRSPHKNYDEDFLLPRQWDAGGHAVGVLAPGGYVLRTDKDGKEWELMSAGYRNAYDFDFNADGELFAYDSDMEWEWGMPWYKPTRVMHAVSAADFGWRSGSAKWPEYYADSLPATVDTGIGSPTGVKFGTKSHFPEKYKRALYAMDWSYGRILAVHLTPKGASYTATYEDLLRGKPLNVTDLEFGKDGAMY